MKQSSVIKSISNFKPPIRPLTDKWVADFSRKNKLDSSSLNTLNQLRKCIARDHFKLQLWKILMDNYVGLVSVKYAKDRIQCEYENDSIVWKCFYGKKVSDIDAAKEYKKYLDDVANLNKKVEVQDAAKKGNKTEELKEIARIIHFQVRICASARILILDNNNNPDF